MIYRIKPLEWARAGERYEARTILCHMKTQPTQRGKWMVSLSMYDMRDVEQALYDTPEEAKAAAWKWYLEQLMPALEPVPE